MQGSKRKMCAMKIICHECGENAVIRKTVRKHKQTSDVYCACLNPECGHTFVMSLSYSHTISPSAMQAERMTELFLGALSPEQKKAALRFLQAAP